MTICERMFAIMKEKGIKSIDVANELNINKSIISAWKSRGTNPPSEYLVQICKLLDVTVNELLGDIQFKYTNEEDELIKYFRRCNEGNKKILINAAKSMQDIQESKSSATKIG